MGFAAIILLIFIIMSAFFISYGRLFRLKDKIINSIEQSEGLSKDDIKNILTENKYTLNGADNLKTCYNIIKYSNGDIRGFTQTVEIYMSMDRTIFGEIFNFKIPVTGETRIIEEGNLFDIINKPTQFESGLGMTKCS